MAYRICFCFVLPIPLSSILCTSCPCQSIKLVLLCTSHIPKVKVKALRLQSCIAPAVSGDVALLRKLQVLNNRCFTVVLFLTFLDELFDQRQHLIENCNIVIPRTRLLTFLWYFCSFLLLPARSYLKTALGCASATLLSYFSTLFSILCLGSGIYHQSGRGRPIAMNSTSAAQLAQFLNTETDEVLLEPC